MSEMEALRGRVITRLYVSPDQHTLYLDTTDGVLAYDAVGDCCSESWFADITGVDALFGFVVNGVEPIGMPDVVDDARGRQEFDKAYGFQITTSAGRAVVAFRNSSNGYYDGWLEDRNTDTIPHDARQITDDWSA